VGAEHSRNVDTSKGIGLAGIASNGTSERVVGNKVSQVNCKVVYFIRVVGRTGVEVVGDPLQIVSISSKQAYQVH